MLRSLTSAAETSETAETTESTTSAEDIAEHGEDVVHRESTAAESSKASCTSQSFETELVVALALLRVVKHVVGLGGLLEFLLSVFVARIAVGMVFDGDAPIGFLDVVFGSILVNAKYLVIISFCHFFFVVM